MTTEASPQVSIVIPVYNGADFLAQSIESALAQTYSHCEIIVVDDGSTDATRDVMAGYGERIRAIHKENGGVATALNAGIRAASGKYVAWLSHDDLFKPEKIERQIDLLIRRSDCAGVYTDFEAINADGEVVSIVRVPEYESRKMMRRLIQALFINGSTLLVERQALLDAGLFDEKVRIGNDALMWVALAHRFKLAHLGEALTQYRVHAGQTTQDMQAMKKDLRIWTRLCFDTYGLADFFPEVVDAPVGSVDRIRAWLHLGDILLYAHLYARLARRLYWQAWREAPSLGNPALGRLVATVAFPLWRRSGNLLRKIYRALFRRSQIFPLYPPGEFDFSQWTERIADPF